MPGHTVPAALQYTKNISFSVMEAGGVSTSNLNSRKPTMPGLTSHVLRFWFSVLWSTTSSIAM